MSAASNPNGATMQFYCKTKTIRKIAFLAVVSWIILSIAHAGSAGVLDSPHATNNKEIAATTRPAAAPDAEQREANPLLIPFYSDTPPFHQGVAWRIMAETAWREALWSIRQTK